MSTYPRRAGLSHVWWRFYFRPPLVSSRASFLAGLALGVALTLVVLA